MQEDKQAGHKRSLARTVTLLGVGGCVIESVKTYTKDDYNQVVVQFIALDPDQKFEVRGSFHRRYERPGCVIVTGPRTHVRLELTSPQNRRA